jgi:hypothetical protein
MSQSQTSSVIRSLENVRERVTQRLANVPEYRAFLAMDKPMAEVADISDLLPHLEAAKQKILDRLKLRAEYQALLTVDNAIKEISGVLDVIGEDAGASAAPAQAAAPVPPPAKAPTAIPAEAPAVGLAALVQGAFAAQLAEEVRAAAAGNAEPSEAKVA